MQKKDIQILKMEESSFGIEIFSLGDMPALAHLHHVYMLPHRHDHYCCFFIESGTMDFTVDFQQLHLGPSSLLVSCPGQIHQPGNAAGLSGWAMVFDAKFIDEHARTVIEHSFAKIALLVLDETEKAWFVRICTLLYATMHPAPAPDTFHRALIQNLLNAFFYKAVTVFQLQETARIQAYSSRSIEIAQTFNQLVKKHFTTLKKPADYAARMNMTVSYLNDTVKSVTGFPSTYFIQQEIFREAQRLLVYTA